jgi:hypothetical protein
MKQWQGMEANADATGDGCQFAENTRFYLDGELQRRRGLVKFAAGIQPRTIAQFWTVASGMKTLTQTNTGTIEAVTST